jgi:hypothetical protein
VDHARVKQNALGDCRFARVDVRGDPDIPRPLERELAIRRIRILRACWFLFLERSRHNRYQRKWAKARSLLSFRAERSEVEESLNVVRRANAQIAM